MYESNDELDAHRPGLGRIPAKLASGLGMIWAGLLIVVGLKMLTGASPGAIGVGAFGFWFGLLSVSAGEFVLMFVVADRLFPQRPWKPAIIAQLLAGGVFVASCIACTWIIAFGHTFADKG